jgi:hypothetical protein
MQPREPAEAAHGSSTQMQESTAPNIEAIRGSMNLRQVAESTGVPVEHLVKQLGLPPDTDPDERIGRLRKRHDISPDDVRRVVSEYHAAH